MSPEKRAVLYMDEQLARLLAACRSEAEEAEQAKAKSAGESAEETVPEPARDRGCLSISRQRAELEQIFETLRREREGGWHASVKWLEENFPEQFAEATTAPKARPSCGTRSSAFCANSELASEASMVEPQCPLIVPESPQNVSAPLPASPSISPFLPLLQNAFWQALLYGNPDSLVSGSDATNALRLVADKIGIATGQNETIPTLRAGQLRKLLRERFGPSMAEQTMATLWRSAPSTPGAPAPGPDQSKLPPGSMPVAGQPRWVRELYDQQSQAMGASSLLEPRSPIVTRITPLVAVIRQ
jgi:hypothetical protein